MDTKRKVAFSYSKNDAFFFGGGMGIYNIKNDLWRYNCMFIYMCNLSHHTLLHLYVILKKLNQRNGMKLNIKHWMDQIK